MGRKTNKILFLKNVNEDGKSPNFDKGKFQGKALSVLNIKYS